MECENAYEFLKKFNAVDIDEEYLESLKEYSKIPNNLHDMLLDIKLLNKRDVGSLIKFRAKVNQKIKAIE